MVLCSNCEFASATGECDDCRSSHRDSLFCCSCRDLHLRSRKNLNHIFREIPRQNYLCSNCEFSAAKFSCLDCPSEEKYYCLGCSILHPKVKATRNHRIYRDDEIEGTDTLPNQSSLTWTQRATIFIRNFTKVTPISEFLEVLYFFDFPNLNYPLITVILPFFCAIAGSFLLARRYIGKNGSSYITIIVTVALLRYIQTRPKSIRKQ